MKHHCGIRDLINQEQNLNANLSISLLLYLDMYIIHIHYVNMTVEERKINN